MSDAAAAATIATTTINTVTNRPVTPNQPITRKEADSSRKKRFYTLIDFRSPGTTQKSIFERLHVPKTTGQEWLRQRRLKGPIGTKRIGKHRSRRPKKISDATLDLLLSPSRNAVRTFPLQAQMAKFSIYTHVRTLERNLRSRKRGAKMFKQAKAGMISEKQRRARKTYGKLHENDTIKNFWQHVFFTDEAHIDASLMDDGRILREPGTRYEPENLQQVPKPEGCSFHLAAYVNWHEIGPLQFYNDSQHDPEVEIKKPKKPRRRPKTETEEQYQQRIRDWEASIPKDHEVKHSGNSMTMIYYKDHILPNYLGAINKSRIYYNRRGILQEDNDGSHGTRSENNIALIEKKKAWVELLKHPANSPDLNPIEACWNILKQRVRRRFWATKAELRAIIEEEWGRITIEEVRARIREMPWRCKQAAARPDLRIKSSLW